jgi:ParB family chromosome partitioning protein
LRLLLLPERVKESLELGEITEGHARALLGLPSAVEQIAMLETLLRRELSVRETEGAVRNWLERDQKSALQDRSLPLRSELAAPEQRLRRALSTNVAISRSSRGGGSIRIDFTSDEQLTELLDRIAGGEIY